MKFPESYRVEGQSNKDGLFYVRYKNKGVKRIIVVIASTGKGWQHASVSIKDGNLKQLPRCPFWDEMKIIKDLFYEKADCVVQYHPPEHDYVNNHEYVLHLWKPIGVEIPRPPIILV